MKKLIIALFTVSVATPAMADHQFIIDELGGNEYSSRGECQSALMKARNERRQAGHTGGRTPSEYNALVKDVRSCERNPNGTWSVR